MPTYVDNGDNYGMWQNRQNKWIIGSYSNVDQNKTNAGVMESRHSTDCPSQSHQWREYYHHKMDDNPNFRVSCIGAYIYSENSRSKTLDRKL